MANTYGTSTFKPEDMWHTSSTGGNVYKTVSSTCSGHRANNSHTDVDWNLFGTDTIISADDYNTIYDAVQAELDEWLAFKDYKGTKAYNDLISYKMIGSRKTKNSVIDDRDLESIHSILEAMLGERGAKHTNTNYGNSGQANRIGTGWKDKNQNSPTSQKTSANRVKRTNSTSTAIKQGAVKGAGLIEKTYSSQFGNNIEGTLIQNEFYNPTGAGKFDATTLWSDNSIEEKFNRCRSNCICDSDCACNAVCNCNNNCDCNYTQ
jgi:hypothetical protein